MHFGHNTEGYLYLNYPHSEMKYPDTSKIMEVNVYDKIFKNTNDSVKFDVYLPTYHLAFEYQGRQHYPEMGDNYLTLKSQSQKNDPQKKITCS